MPVIQPPVSTVFWVLGVGLLPLACGPESTGGARSSDDAVVESTIADADQWIVGDCSLEVGSGTDAAEQFQTVTRAYRVADGLVIADGRALELRFFDEAGAHVTTVGRPGEGPGEFRRFTSLWLTDGDSIMIHDARNARVTVFTPDGVIDRMISTRDVPGMTAASAMGYLNDRLLVQFVSPAPIDWPSEYRRDTLVVRVTAPDWSESQDLLVVPSEERYVQIDPGSGTIGAIYRPRFAYGTDVALWAGKIAYGTQERYEITLLDPNTGATLLLRVTDRPSLPLDAPIVKEYLAKVEAELGAGSELLAAIKRGHESLPPDHGVPAYSGFLVGGDGNLWVRDLPDPTVDAEIQRETWTVFSQGGVAEAIIALAPGFRLLDATNDEVVGRRVTELGVQFAQVCAIRKDG